MKNVVALILMVMLIIATNALAEGTNDNNEDYSWLDNEIPFSIRDGIKFGMSREEIEEIEGVKLVELDGGNRLTLPSTVSLAGNDDFNLYFTLYDNRLYRIQYKSYFPKKGILFGDLAHDGLTIKEEKALMDWLNASTIIEESLEQKYGKYDKNNSISSREYTRVEHIWNITYDDCLVGVDIMETLEDINPTIGVEYTAHNYNSDIEDTIKKENLINDTSNSL